MIIKSKYLNPVLNVIAMSLVILSRDKFDWFAIAALVIILLSVGSIVFIYRKSK